MKKRFFIICLTFLLLFCTIILSSCNNVGNNNNNDNTDNSTENTDGGNQESNNDDTSDTNKPDDDVENSAASKGLEFYLSDDETTYILSGIGDCKDKAIVIPSKHNGLPVSGISVYAFSYEDIVSVTIPEGVTTIANSAFSDCSALIKVVLPASLTQIGEEAFSGCERLIEIYNLSKLNISIGASDFGGIGLYAKEIHSSLSDTSMLNQVNDYIFASYDGNHYLYAYTGNDDMLVLPENYKGSNYQIARNAFYGNRTLTQITIPKAVTLIGMDAFTGCYSLVEVYNLSALQLWAGSTTPDEDGDGRAAFYARAVHTSLDEPSILEKSNGFVFMEVEDTAYLVRALNDTIEVTLPENYHGKNYEIYENAFYRNETIEKITFSNAVTAIGDYAFMDCNKLSNVVLPDSLITIGEHAFAGCYAIRTLSVPNNVENVEWEAFSNLSKELFNEYDNAYYLGNTANPYLILVEAKAKNITSCNIHENTKFILSNAFEGCSNLNNLTIPSNVVSIGSHAFDDCSSLTNVIFSNPVGWYVDDWNQTQLESSVLANGQIAADYLTDVYRFEDLKRTAQ